MNLLNLESSPYLLQHKDNPVHWQAWSKEVLAKARAQHKLILVSIGYSTCHWCHVMAHESFEDPLTAEIMNAHFINVKIDREERPDLDHYFMDAIQAMGVSGGWPLHCFLSPEGIPFFGGTYFPPVPKYGRPSWNQLLMSIQNTFVEKESHILEQAKTIGDHLKKLQLSKHPKNLPSEAVDLHAVLQKLQVSMDVEHGGFGSHPKFPNTQALQLLFFIYYKTRNQEALDHALKSLFKMCQGGIYDHIAGGFCRYSVDESWNVPHFEKMLYDHAQIMKVLSVYYQIRKSPFIKSIADQSFSFFESNLMDPNGLFYAAMDADSEGEEGSFYIWKEELLKKILGGDYQVFRKSYTMTSLDHLNTDKKVLRLIDNLISDTDIKESLDLNSESLLKLKAHRELREKPSIDHKMIVSWNAMLVTAYVSWYKFTGEVQYKTKAVSLMESIRAQVFYTENELCRYVIDGVKKGSGFLEDYGYTIEALIEIYSMDMELHYYNTAKRLFDAVLIAFKNQDSFLLNMASNAYPDFNHTIVDWAETSYPNPNAVFCKMAKYFYECTLETKYQLQSIGMLNEIKTQALQHPLHMASWVQLAIENDLGSGTIKLKSNAEYIDICSLCFLPDFIRIPLKDDFSGIQICYSNQCYPAQENPKDVVSLISKLNLGVV